MYLLKMVGIFYKMVGLFYIGAFEHEVEENSGGDRKSQAASSV